MMQKEQLHVIGMTCGHCVRTIEGAVCQLDGVSSVKVLLEEAKVSVEFDEEKILLDVIKESIDEVGYEVE